ncbi:hypothetical protein PENSPDRAFT_672689, partial [Peniophora sp. CONT]
MTEEAGHESDDQERRDEGDEDEQAMDVDETMLNFGSERSKISKFNQSKKRLHVNSSQSNASDEDVNGRPSKRYISDSETGKRVIRATAYGQSVDLGMRGMSKGAHSSARTAPGKSIAPLQKSKEKNVAKSHHSEPNVYSTPSSKGKGQKPAMNKEEHTVSLQDRGCEVTDESKQTGPLLGTYFALEPLKSSKFACSNELAGANLGILFTGKQFAQGNNLERVRSLVTTARIMTAFITNPARDDPDDFMFKAIGQQSIFAFKSGGEVADVIVFGFVMRSSVVEGRTYNANNSTRQIKDIEVIPIAQEGDRLLAMLSMVTGGKIMSLSVTDDGALTFSTKHTMVDESGNPESKKNKLGNDFIQAAGRNQLQRGRVHQDIQRRAREGTDTIPVFNADGHFSGNAPFKAEDILTQRSRVDPSWNREIPVGSFVAVHSTVTV